MNIKTIKTKILGLVALISFSINSMEAQQVRNVGDFNSIKAGDAFNIVISQSDANSVQVEADEKIISQIKTEVKDSTLSVFTEGNIKTDKPIIITIGIKSLTNLDVSGSADVKSSNQLICDKLVVKSNGAGDIHLDLKTNEVQANVSSAGDVTLKGTAQMLDATVSGAGDLKASNLEAHKVIAKAKGAGTAKVNAVQSIDADISGAGSIIYKGNPVDRIVNISGAGSVRESKSGNGEETAGDTTKFKFGKKKYIIIGDDDDNEYANNKKDSIENYSSNFKNWSGIELGVNGFLDYKNRLNTPDSGAFLELDYAKSFQFGLNLLEKDFHIYKNYINLVTGLGFDFNHYAFKNNVTLNADTSFLSASKDPVEYKKNKLNVTYLKVPLMLEINTSKNSENNFHIAGGIEFAYRIHSVTKQKYDLKDKHYSGKQRDDYNLAPFLYSAVARIGYNNFSVFANYGLNRLFTKDKGPQAYPFTVGLTISM